MSLVSRMKKNRSLFWALLILLLAFGLFAYLKATKPHQPPVAVKPKVWPVQVMAVEKHAWQPITPLYGQVTAPQQVTVVAPISARVAQLPVLAGDKVASGQLLVALDEVERTLPLKKAQAQLEQAKAQLVQQQQATEANREQLAQAETILKLKQEAVVRTQQLIKRKLASQSALDLAKEAVVRQQQAVTQAKLAVEQQAARLQQLQAGVELAKANLEQAKLNAERSVVKAPVTKSGFVRVAEVKTAVGNQVNPNTPLLSYYDPEQLEVSAELPMSLYRKMLPDWQAGLGILGKTDFAGESLSLRLVRLAAKGKTSGVEAYFQPVLTDASREKLEDWLVPGALVSFDVQLAPVEESFAVPYTALYGMNKVYVLDHGVLKSVAVQFLGDVKVKGQQWALLKAASPGTIPDGTQVMVTHLPNAINGLRVKVLSVTPVAKETH